MEVEVQRLRDKVRLVNSPDLEVRMWVGVKLPSSR